MKITKGKEAHPWHLKGATCTPHPCSPEQLVCWQYSTTLSLRF